CNKYCPNRVLQNGVRVKLEVFKTEGKVTSFFLPWYLTVIIVITISINTLNLQGWAVRAGEPIERGTFVCEYIGEVIDKNEANKRRARLGREACSFIYEIDARVNDMIRLMDGEATYAIDATKYGNVSRYLNHRYNIFLFFLF
ncbi:hypothetical protein M8C21_027213, partial [Ambrosia artemisiifolia]